MVSNETCIVLQPIQRDAEVLAEDEQAFLMKQQTQLSKQPTAGTRPVRYPAAFNSSSMGHNLPQCKICLAYDILGLFYWNLSVMIL